MFLAFFGGKYLKIPKIQSAEIGFGHSAAKTESHDNFGALFGHV